MTIYQLIQERGVNKFIRARMISRRRAKTFKAYETYLAYRKDGHNKSNSVELTLRDHKIGRRTLWELIRWLESPI